MSTLKINRAQFGQSGTATNNFTLTAEAADGTLKLARGNTGATTQDIITVASDGKVNFPAGLSTTYTPIGLGQTWQDVKSSRAIGTTYTNNTGRPIFVSVVCSVNSGVVNTLTVGSVVVAQSSVGVIGNGLPLQAIVPDNTSYSVTNSGGTTIQYWAELR